MNSGLPAVLFTGVKGGPGTGLFPALSFYGTPCSARITAVEHSPGPGDLRGSGSVPSPKSSSSPTSTTCAMISEFSSSKKSSNVELLKGNKHASSKSSSNSYAAVDYEISSGKATWEFTLVKDKNSDECSCFGCCRPVVKDESYSTSTDMWMLRACA